ncbi:response regulator [Paracraurococcus ruber]|uniref:Two-component system response regulator n=1 Tax=Paracraurococcus ruber TaxID=77675 RepID=A0ABS1CYE7_9PROT|nr:response regulator [Paracraurococcus ruber]MBK1659328.1 two-component system response regulator [Paracraurococcus ruber]TDG29811.1 response regulator [Paracraurococcus ruber]
MTGKTVTILLVEDDIVDRMAVRRAFKTLKILNPVIEVGDGVEALERLRGENGQEKVPSPCLVLLDLNMPRMDGIEFLSVLRSDPALHRMIVFVMTTSQAEEDMLEAYDHNVAGYLVKQRIGQDFLASISMLEAFWRVVEFPH